MHAFAKPAATFTYLRRLYHVAGSVWWRIGTSLSLMPPSCTLWRVVSTPDFPPISIWSRGETPCGSVSRGGSKSQLVQGAWNQRPIMSYRFHKICLARCRKSALWQEGHYLLCLRENRSQAQGGHMWVSYQDVVLLESYCLVWYNNHLGANQGWDPPHSAGSSLKVPHRTQDAYICRLP